MSATTPVMNYPGSFTSFAQFQTTLARTATPLELIVASNPAKPDPLNIPNGSFLLNDVFTSDLAFPVIQCAIRI